MPTLSQDFPSSQPKTAHSWVQAFKQSGYISFTRTASQGLKVLEL
jgi:hypothetical protein